MNVNTVDYPFCSIAAASQWSPQS